jgi:peptidoglycan/xylan/chitin deacetylase (PgdA/CDA1 family)
MTRTIQSLLGRVIFESGLGAPLARRGALVVGFHRVHDAPDSRGLTTSIAMFERHCRFFRRHFRVVPLRDIVEKLERGIAPNGELAITFDDGYRDNFENAAPILEKLSLPATFFVVTRWIGTDVVAWWDQEDGVRHPWMTWDDVRSLHGRGFAVGSHTRTHANLGRISGPEAEDEIRGSRIELQNRIGAPVDLFAYPYGGRDNVTEANRSLVRAAGYRCCCSGVAGVNRAGTDPHHLLRIPISPWYESPHQFGFEAARGMLATSGSHRTARQA